MPTDPSINTAASAVELDALETLAQTAMIADRRAFGRRIAGLRHRAARGKPVDRATAKLRSAIEASAARCERRRRAVPTIRFPSELPVTTRREAIAEAIRGHQVVVVAGETGSGKTTQLPKLCLELGRGVAGLIGHTQPRRIAARTVSARIAEELGSEVGAAVGYKVRFTDRVGTSSHIKLMTDGILLAETQGDPLLEQYDTLIIDEAHERSLNIDFLLGYVKRLLPQRPDLKVVITSATIDTERFARHFDAPVVEVSGRTYPVDILYRPLVVEDEDERDRSLLEGLADAVDEAGRLDPLGDILVFLPGERDIRDAAEILGRRRLRDTEILPLFSRLSVAEQNKVFQGHPGRRIVLATNVAETSLTVPGIRFVIDSGLARISRYSHRTKVQRLPIEAVSQASANQRAGRCGRVGPGICFRLFAEEDFLGRPEFTEPEIRRTNLASVILQMMNLGLGGVEEFPFIDPPDRRYINDGYRVLHELGAVDAQRRMTPLGRELARLPVDPRIGRMVLAARHEGALAEVLVIASALAVQDPRERPMDAQQKADQAHRELADEESDFLSLLRLWDRYHEQARHLSQRKLRRWCHDHFISYLRMREWHDIHGQLMAMVKGAGTHLNEEPAGYAAVHRSLLAGLLSQVAQKTDEASSGKGRRRSAEYTGGRNVKLTVFPGSALARKGPKWIMAAELMETSRLFAKTVAGIKPAWIEELGAHLLKRSYSEPHWEKRPAQVGAFEQVTLYGLVVVPRRRVNYGPIDPVTSREIFIRRALVDGDYRSDAPFLKHNRALLGEVEAIEAKSRRRDLLVDQEVLFAFYDERVPEGIYSGAAFEKWRRKAEGDEPRRLFLSRELLMRHDAGSITTEKFPDRLTAGGIALSLEYRFEPGHAEDGVTAVIPVAALNQLPEARFEWLVCGLLEEKVTALIRALPKALRRNFVPAPDFARACLEGMAPEAQDEPLTEAVRRRLLRISGIDVPADAWEGIVLPDHLRMHFRVVDGDGRPLGSGRDLAELRERLAGKARESLRAAPGTGLEREGLQRWDLGELPEEVSLEQHGVRLTGYPALVDEGESVAVRVFDRRESADRAMAAGLCRLFRLEQAREVRYLRKNLPNLDRMCLLFAAAGPCESLREDLIAAVTARAVLGGGGTPRDRAAWERRRDTARAELIAVGNDVAGRVMESLEIFHQLRKRLKGAISPAWLEAVQDINGQIEHLVYPGFVAATPFPWLAHLPRFLRGIALRLDKLERDPSRDRRAQLEVAPFWTEYLRREAAGEENPDLESFRWLIEELRVSLFAQELGTSVPVSVKRAEAQRKKLRR